MLFRTKHEQRIRSFIAIWFFNLTLDLILKEQPKLKQRPLCLVKRSGKKKIVAKTNTIASALGLTKGSLLNDAQTTTPGLVIIEDIPINLKKKILDKILIQLYSITPKISIAKDSTLILNFSHDYQNFSANKAIIKKIDQISDKFKINLKIGIGDTAGAAWAKCHFLKEESYRTKKEGCSPYPIRQIISNLPIESLRLNSDAIVKLNNVGIKNVGQLGKIPKNEIYPRIGKETPDLLDKISGKKAEMLPAIKILPRFQVQQEYAYL